MNELLRQYESSESGPDGYPVEWHRVIHGTRVAQLLPIKDYIRELAGHRCQRCRHPYVKGDHPLNAEGDSWSPCDELCDHAGAPIRWRGSKDEPWKTSELYFVPEPEEAEMRYVEALWRVLTVHHLDEDKLNCRWWNLTALCQRCHLRMQRAVVMGRVYSFEHSEWFKPHAAGFYAWKYLGEELGREETLTRLPELLALEHRFTQEALL